MRIYTTYFAQVSKLREDILPISIALYTPNWWRGAVMLDLAPSADTFKAYKNGDIDEKTYTVDYLIHLNALYDADVIWDQLKLMTTRAGKRDCALVCYERPERFCHRHLAAQWIEDKMNLDNWIETGEIEEYGFK